MIPIPKPLFFAIIKYLQSKPASQECRRLLKALLETEDGCD